MTYILKANVGTKYDSPHLHNQKLFLPNPFHKSGSHFVFLNIKIYSNNKSSVLFLPYLLKLIAAGHDLSNLREGLVGLERKRLDKNYFVLQKNFYQLLFPSALLISDKVGGDLEHERLIRKKDNLDLGLNPKHTEYYIKTPIHFKQPYVRQTVSCLPRTNLRRASLGIFCFFNAYLQSCTAAHVLEQTLHGQARI